MNTVDNVALSETPTVKQHCSLIRLTTLANSAKRAATWASRSGKVTQHTGKCNNLGRYCWIAQLDPVPATCEVLDFLLPGMKIACWSKSDNGEYRLWMCFTVRVHHETLRGMLRNEGLTVLYITGCKYRDVLASFETCAPNRLCKK